ncbi:hypothetical protein GCM10020258_52320 [Sphingomonas yabuuchiae]
MLGSPDVGPSREQVRGQSCRYFRCYDSIRERRGVVELGRKVWGKRFAEQERERIAILRCKSGISRNIRLGCAKSNLRPAQIELGNVAHLDELVCEVVGSLLGRQGILRKAQHGLIGAKRQIGIRHFGDEAELSSGPVLLDREIGFPRLIAETADATPQIKLPSRNSSADLILPPVVE